MDGVGRSDLLVRLALAAAGIGVIIVGAVQFPALAWVWEPCFTAVDYNTRACMQLQSYFSVGALYAVWSLLTLALLAAYIIAVVTRRLRLIIGVAFAVSLSGNVIGDNVTVPLFNGGYFSHDSPPGAGMVTAASIIAVGAVLAFGAVAPGSRIAVGRGGRPWIAPFDSVAAITRFALAALGAGYVVCGALLFPSLAAAWEPCFGALGFDTEACLQAQTDFAYGDVETVWTFLALTAVACVAAALVFRRQRRILGISLAVLLCGNIVVDFFVIPLVNGGYASHDTAPGAGMLVVASIITSGAVLIFGSAISATAGTVGPVAGAAVGAAVGAATGAAVEPAPGAGADLALSQARSLEE